MFLANPRFLTIVKKQYCYKLKAYAQVFFSMVFVQMIALSFSFAGSGSMGGGGDGMDLAVSYYTVDTVQFFTMFWSMITAFLLTTKAYRYEDFTFVANRLSSNLANLFFLLTCSLIGALTSVLSESLMKVIMIYGYGKMLLETGGAVHGFSKFILGFTGSSGYIFLFCAFGYFLGTIVQLHKTFAVIIPAVLFGSLMLATSSGHEESILNMIKIIFAEPSLPLFLFKVIMLAGVLFGGSFALSNRSEVR